MSTGHGGKSGVAELEQEKARLETDIEKTGKDFVRYATEAEAYGSRIYEGYKETTAWDYLQQFAFMVAVIRGGKDVTDLKTETRIKHSLRREFERMATVEQKKLDELVEEHKRTTAEIEPRRRAAATTEGPGPAPGATGLRPLRARTYHGSMGRGRYLAFAVVAAGTLLVACTEASDGDAGPDAAESDGLSVDGGADAVAAPDGDADADAEPLGTLKVACTTSDDCSEAFPILTRCQLAVCGTDGYCAVGEVKPYDPCDDDDACTLNDYCLGPICTHDLTLTCNDGEVCTDDACHPAHGCIHSPIAGTCDDGLACTTDDACIQGDCVGTPLTCPDDVTCQSIGCNASTGLCETHPVPDHSACEDGNPCTEADACQSGVCTGTPVTCDDGDACTDDTCSDGICGATPSDCDDGDPCTDDSCDTTLGCQHMAAPGCECARYGFSWNDGYDVLQQGTFDVVAGEIVAIDFEYTLLQAGACNDLSSAWCHFPGATWTIEWSDFASLTPSGFHVKARSEHDTDLYFYREDWLGVPAVYLYKPVGSQVTTAWDGPKTPTITWTSLGACP